MTDGIQAAKNLAKISNKLVKAECEPAGEYRIPGSQKHQGNAHLLTLFSHAPQGAHKKSWGETREWREPRSCSWPGGEEKQLL